VGYRLREIEAGRKFSQELELTVLGRSVPKRDIEAALEAEGLETERERKLNLVVTVYLIIAMALYPRACLSGVLAKIAQGLRYIWPEDEYVLAKDSAISYRRAQVGVRVMRRLFQQVCQPLATPDTLGAFRFGLRLLAVDGTVEELPDTPSNSAYFGRQLSDRGPSAFPQVRAVYLVECGTHAIVDAGFWPYAISERVGAWRLLRSVGQGDLLMWDRGFHEYDLLVATHRQRGAHVLGRLPACVKPKFIRTLSDGSSLVSLYPTERKRRARGEHDVVRLIEYTVTDPALPGYGEPHRLITTLLDPVLAPALDLGHRYQVKEIERLSSRLYWGERTG
jgi:hypothetical protein